MWGRRGEGGTVPPILSTITGKLIIGNYRNLSEFRRQTAAQLFYDRFRGVFGANSSFAAVTEVFWELIAPNLMILLLFR